jgi:alpha-1,2-mannosyltransferase
MRTEGFRVLLVRTAYALALVVAVGWAFLYLSVSAGNGTLGYDFEAYRLAVERLLAGQSMYDLGATSMGAFGLFFYPPPFAVLVLPFAVIPGDLGVLVWTGLLIGASVAAIWLMPVSARTRWLVLLLAAFCWPLVYAIKLGQVGSVLLLTFAIGWRWLDRPWPFGLATGIGAIVKLQPALLVGWALVTRRWRAAAIAVGIFVVFGLVATVVAGPQAWLDWLAVLGNVSRPVLAENDMGFGRQAYLAGVPIETATLIHYANIAAVVVVTTVAVLRATPVAAYLAVVVASQFVSPVLWDHYALLLLLPVAWLLDRRHWWAALVPLATATLLAGITPGIAYPVLFWVVLVAVTWVGIRAARRPSRPAWAAEARPANRGAAEPTTGA